MIWKGSCSTTGGLLVTIGSIDESEILVCVVAIHSDTVSVCMSIGRVGIYTSAQYRSCCFWDE
jgi:hypothetical protein